MASGLSAVEKVERDERVVCDRVRGLTWATIAAAHGLSVRQCQNIVAARLDARRTGAVDDNTRIKLDELLMQLEASVEELALLAEKTGNDAVRLGATKAKVALLTQRSRVASLSNRREIVKRVGMPPAGIEPAHAV